MVSKPDTEWCVSEDAVPSKWWIVRSHINWREKRSIIRVWKPHTSKHVIKTVRLTTIRNGSKRTISANSGFGLLRNGIKARHGVVCQRGCCALKGVDCEISHQLEREMKHSL